MKGNFFINVRKRLRIGGCNMEESSTLLTIVGLLIIISIVTLLIIKKISPVVGMILIPIVGALLIGHGFGDI